MQADQTAVMIQKKVHDAAGRILPANSFEPEAPSRQMSWGKSHIRINDLAYGTKYPNSFLDLYLPDRNTEGKKPLFLYAHGGGFLFCGKAVGDAVAHGTGMQVGFNGFLERLLSMGIIVASMEYAMAPEYRFPVAVFQMLEALDFLVRQEKIYGIDTGKIILGGSSAGADMVEISGLILSSPEYAARFGITKLAVDFRQIACLVIDESALTDYEPINQNEKILDQVWMGEENLKDSEKKRLAFVPAHITKRYPPSFLIASNEQEWFTNSMMPLKEALERVGIENEYFCPEPSEGKFSHGFMMRFGENRISSLCFERMLDFIKTYLGK